MKIIEALNIAKSKLIMCNISDREARLLLAHVLNINKEELIKYSEISDEQYTSFKNVISQRCNGRPYAYIVGHKEFMGIDFVVNESVLIPREDTEVLVETVVNEIYKYHEKNANSKIRILDMCTGSGCIAISLAWLLIKNEITDFNITAVDKSKEAIEVAKQNANYILKDSSNKIEFIHSDLFESVDDDYKYEVIVSNPPYIQTDVISTLQKEVKDNEPMMALDGGEDGLDFYRKISLEAKDYINTNGMIAFEIGYDQGESVMQILSNNEYKEIDIIKDFSNNDRVVLARK